MDVTCCVPHAYLTTVPLRPLLPSRPACPGKPGSPGNPVSPFGPGMPRPPGEPSLPGSPGIIMPGSPCNTEIQTITVYYALQICQNIFFTREERGPRGATFPPAAAESPAAFYPRGYRGGGRTKAGGRASPRRRGEGARLPPARHGGRAERGCRAAEGRRAPGTDPPTGTGGLRLSDLREDAAE